MKKRFYTYKFKNFLKIGGLGLLVVTLMGCPTRKQNQIVQNNPAKSGLSKIEKNEVYQGQGGQAKVVVAEGKAEILESGEQVAYERAKEHAFRNAIEQVLGTLIDAKTEVVDAILIEDVIYAQSSGFIEKYQVLAEGNTGNVKRLSLRAWVVAKDLEESALVYRVLQNRIGLPRVALWVHHASTVEPSRERTSTLAAVKAKLGEVLVEKKILIVNESIREQTREEFFKEISNKNSLTQQKNKVQNVDIVVEVILSVNENDITGNKYLAKRSLSSVTTELALEVYSAQSGTVLFSDAQTGTGIALQKVSAASEGGLKALEKLHPRLLKQLFAYWDEQLQEGSLYEIRIQGLTGLEARSIGERLNNRYIEGIVDVFDRGFSSGTQTFTIRYLGQLSEIIPFILAPQKIPVPLELVNSSPTLILFQKI